jgi:hypothetical protein
MNVHYEKMGWFATNLITRFFNCNDHLQSITTQWISTSVSAIGQIVWLTTNAIHCMWNHIHIQLMQLSYNYVTLMQLPW